MRPISIWRRRVQEFILPNGIHGRMVPTAVRYGAWDVMCNICTAKGIGWGNGDYPVGRDTAFKMGLKHLIDEHS